MGALEWISDIKENLSVMHVNCNAMSRAMQQKSQEFMEKLFIPGPNISVRE